MVITGYGWLLLVMGITGYDGLWMVIIMEDCGWLLSVLCTQGVYYVDDIRPEKIVNDCHCIKPDT